MVVISIISLLTSIIIANLSQVRNKGLVAAGQLFESNVNAKIGDSLIAEYTFDESSGNIAYDSSGNSQNLTNESASMQRVPGVSGSALEVNDLNDDVSTNNFNNFPYDEGALSFWIKPKDTNSTFSQSPLFNAGGSNDSTRRFWVALGMQSSISNFPGLFNAVNNWMPQFNSGFDASKMFGHWNHVLITWTTSNKVALYVNGVFISSYTYTPANLNGNKLFAPGTGSYGRFNIGGDDDARYTLMDMDRVRLYSKPYELQ